MSDVTIEEGSPVELTVEEGDPVVLTLSLGPSVLDGDKGDVEVSSNGGSWTVEGLQGRAVSATAPTNGYALVWNSTTSEWEPQAQSGGGGISDGDKGDVTVSGSGSTWTIDNDAVTFAKMQNVAADVLLGRATVGTGDVETITCTAAGRAILDDADEKAQRATLSAAPDTARFIVQETDPELGNAQSLGNLTTGILKNTTTLGVGVLSIATGTDLPAHAHGNISSGGAIGSTDGLVVKTGTSGALETLALPAGKSVLTSTSTAGSLAWELASGLGGLVTITEHTFTSSGTFTQNAACKYVVVEMCGGGGGGGNGTANGAAGVGGCAGLYWSGSIASGDLGTTTTVTIGAGGGAGTDGSATSLTNATTSVVLCEVNGGRGASASNYTIHGIAVGNAFGSGGSANGSGGKHGGYGAGGGGGGHNNSTSGTAGGRACSMLITSNNAAAGGGAAGGTASGNGSDASVTVRGFGEGAGGGGGRVGTSGSVGNGGAGIRGSGGGGGGASTTAGGTGGSGGSGFVRIIEVRVA